MTTSTSKLQGAAPESRANAARFALRLSAALVTLILLNGCGGEGGNGQEVEGPCDDAADGATECDEPGEVCFEGACEIGCFIDGVYYAPEAPSPDGPCLVCDPADATTQWSAAPAETPCAAGWVCDGDGQCVALPEPEHLEVFLDGNGSGAVTSSPEGIDCAPDCDFEYEAGTSVTLEAVAATGSQFAGWSGDCTGGDTICEVTMDEARTVTATFSIEDYELVVTLDGDGSGAVTSEPAGIDCGSICSAFFPFGQLVTLEAEAAEDSTFAGWSGACAGDACTLAMDGDLQATAEFALNVYTLTYEAGDDGSIDGDSPQQVVHGGSGSVVTAVPDAGFRFAGWSDGVETPSRTDTDVTGDLFVTAEFAELDFEWAAWPVPPDEPDDYTITADTVTDNVTGLVWQRQVPADQPNFFNASPYCEDLVLAGESDWRLPTLIELESIVDFGRASPSINTTAFPDTPSMRYWSSSSRASSAFDAWVVNFDNGYIIDSSTAFSNTNRVRCVRSDSGGAPEDRYTIAEDTVHDEVTGLIWQREVPTQVFSWEAASAYCDALTLDGQSDWRLPEAKELRSLVDIRAFDPAIDAAAFPSTPSARFWSATAYSASDSSGVWVDFDSGHTDPNSGIYEYHVRCVR